MFNLLQKPVSANNSSGPPRFLTWAAQLATFAVAGMAAFLVRFEFQIPRIPFRENLAEQQPI